MSFTSEARTAAEELWEKSKKHAFIQELQAGTLSSDIFRYYLLQDRYYLEQFAKIHQKAADIAVREEEKQLFLAGVIGLEEAEIAVREGFFKELKISNEEIAMVPIAPTAYHYTTHMHSELSTGSTARTAAALLPCYWLYQEIGEQLIESGSSNPLYQRWIETYDSEGYREAVTRQKELTDRLAASATKTERQAMLQGFLISSYQEWKFWEMAYVQEKWEDSACIHII
ncbi:thiaminase II [Enterococcus sp. BWM-S5]|uniref:Aminopyrimidine aminohydrolase n=1 Tax=Enterococcus larvae TaxID=2794352 RepID=A0ABS4CM27_9ENTE|nr:thiaminase II [Enterococcus larvae]MBP1047480.1 thiaminase II [Enterococcus larvae]